MSVSARNNAPCRLHGLKGAGSESLYSKTTNVLTLGVFTLGDARSIFGLTSKIPSLESMLNFDAGVKQKRPSVTNMKTPCCFGGGACYWTCLTFNITPDTWTLRT